MVKSWLVVQECDNPLSDSVAQTDTVEIRGVQFMARLSFEDFGNCFPLQCLPLAKAYNLQSLAEGVYLGVRGI